jgi:Ca2+/H+ antiporter
MEYDRKEGKMKDSTKNYILIGMVVVLGIAACVPARNADPSQFNWNNIALFGMFVMLIPITAIIAFSMLIYHLARQRHARIMAMISKGTYEHKPLNWRLILLFVGVFLIFVAPGAALLMTVEESLLEGIGLGILLFLGGIGILVFRHLGMKYLPPLDDQNL